MISKTEKLNRDYRKALRDELAAQLGDEMADIVMGCTQTSIIPIPEEETEA